MKNILYQKSYLFTLYQEEENIILSVLCGTVGTYEVDVILKEKQLAHYQAEGNEYIDRLADDVLNSPKNYTTC